MAPPDDYSLCQIVFLIVEEKHTTAPKPIKKKFGVEEKPNTQGRSAR